MTLLRLLIGLSILVMAAMMIWTGEMPPATRLGGMFAGLLALITMSESK